VGPRASLEAMAKTKIPIVANSVNWILVAQSVA